MAWLQRDKLAGPASDSAPPDPSLLTLLMLPLQTQLLLMCGKLHMTLAGKALAGVRESVCARAEASPIVCLASVSIACDNCPPCLTTPDNTCMWATVADAAHRLAACEAMGLDPFSDEQVRGCIQR